MTNTTIPDDFNPITDSMKADRFTAAFVWVDASIARRRLQRNESNRNINQRLVERYRADMAAGDWSFTGEAIKFSVDGQLLDGQHRLNGVVEADANVLMLVVRGLDRDAQDVMDTGRKRSAADMLQMHGTSNAVLTASTARLVVAHLSGVVRTSDTQFFGEITNSQILRLVDSDPTIKWAVQNAIRIHATDLSVTPTAIGVSLWLAGDIDADGMRDFLLDAGQMRTDGPGDPRYTLARRLRSATDNKDRLTTTQQSWLVCRAFDAHLHGKTLKVLKLTNSPFPKWATKRVTP